ncbi:MBL fold metallo-hydrolase [Pectobacterium brasiliense]|uniref:MBL fold metallo-hydrolase n=1 Tax=Pectobacterium brasiliense TaxID=180957 RepID=UPI0015DD8796|nr:MBL fold metallo-hydrolase [Pectobacterium brasiliense]MBA0219606.1 MBL fold metallo-hydrolase [Pectobacterium brasiliense]MBN3072711.1 MBL fold metallo-hydrolase [Pectobacterium brasiliense]MBN3170695.1 MBL fold metallo-hydrolase [Pectobacterium brasiliense]
MPYKLRKRSTIRDEIKQTHVPYGVLAIWSLGQAGFVLKNSHNNILVIDPYLTRSIEVNHPGTEFVRAFDPVIDPEDISCADAVLITHHHDDHMDLSTLEGIAAVRRDMSFYIPSVDADALIRSNANIQGNIYPALTGIEFSIGSYRIKPIPSAHSNYEKNEQGHDRYLGYLITTDNLSFYHCGDSLLTPELEEEVTSLEPDIIALPINGGDYSRGKRGIIPNMNFRDAADLYNQSKADMMLPFHFDMFECNTDNPSYFVDYMLSAYPGNKFHLMVPGERFIYMK